MKSILLMVHDDEGMEARLQCALDIVRAQDGRLLCLDLTRPPLVVDAFTSVAVIDVDDQAREDALVQRLDERLTQEGISRDWARVRGEFEMAIAEQARLVDLIVLSRSGVESLGDQNDLAARVAGQVQVPVMVVPPDQNGIDLFGKAIVGWDGEAAADAAIRAAVPLLRHSDLVEVVTIGDRCPGAAEEAARYLADHGCTVEARSLPESSHVGEQLLAAIASSGASWGVMGSYGHGRIREMLFGGTSKSLLAHTPIPLVIAH